ncbi:MAG TPA: hypothetical protein VNG29_03685 [Candidatus Paceibacterota bacterium]|nr:hypothetical protein [Candidatus Paceibacterota bacterium]
MKIVNFILGLGTAIIIGALIQLGIQAFNPAPVPPQYPNYPVAVPYVNCTPSDAQCIAQQKTANEAQQAAQSRYNTAQDAYTVAMKIYGYYAFVAANVAGIAVFVFGFWLLFATALTARSVPIGIMVSGLYAIIYGYARGWGSVGDQPKFFVGLVIAAIVIGGSMWLMQRHAKEEVKK